MSEQGWIHFSTFIFLQEDDQLWRTSSGKIIDDQPNYDHEQIHFETAVSSDQSVRQEEEEEVDELPDIPFVATSKARNTDSDHEQKVVKEKERDLGRMLSGPEEEYVKLQVKKNRSSPC